jgi:Na+/alanine symporter
VSGHSYVYWGIGLASMLFLFGTVLTVLYYNTRKMAFISENTNKFTLIETFLI